ncbi:30455_t:CDS:2, partial [Gigaspora margarita]
DKNYFSIDKAVETISNDKSSYIENYENFCSKIISKNEPYFAVYDFEYKKLNGGRRNKIILISWVPKNADAQDKFLSAASKLVLKERFQIAHLIKGTVADEIGVETILDKLNKNIAIY